MKIAFLPQAQEDWDYWKNTHNVKITKRIKKLLADIQQHPFTGIGKPEPLKGNQQDKWSRRITDEHRLIYKISNGMIFVYVVSMRFHYGQ